MIVVIDNYDSFTWNIVQYLGELGADVQVFRNDQITCQELDALNPSGLLISPGPGNPDSAGISLEAVAHFAGKIPVFGVCLGLQTIGQHFGGKVVLATDVMHGKISSVHHDGVGVFANLPSPISCTRYHSLVLEGSSLPNSLQVTAWTEDSSGNRVEIMGAKHHELDVEGVQYHPESISSEHGHAQLKRFLLRTGDIT